jgi:hypothetical protein
VLAGFTSCLVCGGACTWDGLVVAENYCCSPTLGRKNVQAAKLGNHNPLHLHVSSSSHFQRSTASSCSLQVALKGWIGDMHRTFTRLTHCSSRSAFVPLNSRQIVASGTACATGSQLGLPHSVGSENPVSNVISKSHKATLYTSNRAGSGQGFQSGPSSKKIRGQAASASVVASAASMTEVQRDFDVVVWGATGFVGRLICERLARKYQVRSCTLPPASCPQKVMVMQA